MKTLFLLILITINHAYAFEPTNFNGSKQEIRTLFEDLWSKFKSFDNYHCYRRAHILANQMDQEFKVKSMKVFFFKGDKLKMPMDWYYHVAPLVYHKETPVVLDKGLFDGATYLSDWLESFGEGHTCKEITSMDEYRKLKSTEHCMYFIVPMYYYSPKDLESLELNKFINTDLSDMLFSLPRRQRQKYRSIYLSDEKFKSHI